MKVLYNEDPDSYDSRVPQSHARPGVFLLNTFGKEPSVEIAVFKDGDWVQLYPSRDNNWSLEPLWDVAVPEGVPQYDRAAAIVTAAVLVGEMSAGDHAYLLELCRARP